MAGPIAQRVYDLYARFYDTFDFLFAGRLGNAVKAAGFRPGSRVLDVGVGTGISLAAYPAGLNVVGIDLSGGMLREAGKKVRRAAAASGARVDLLRCDAGRLPFADGVFDGAVLSHVISTVPDPAAVLTEALRVCRPGARLVIVNHFRSDLPVRRAAERAIDPLCRKLGWRSDFCLTDLLEEAGIHGSVDCGTGLFQTIHLQKLDAFVRVVEAGETHNQPQVAVGNDQ